MIRHFPNITELNVSAFGSEQQLRSFDPRLKTILDESLRELVNLKRLRLNALDLTSSLRVLLGSLVQPLEHLNVTSSRLDADDLEYLAESVHARSLRVLILSNTDLELLPTPLVRRLLSKFFQQ